MEYQRQTPGYLWIVSLAQQISRTIHLKIRSWPYLDRQEIGDQLVRAGDSIGLNISEGYARAHRKDRRRFYAMAEGSLEEALFAVRLARDRGLLSRLDSSILSGLLIRLSGALQKFIRSLD